MKQGIKISLMKQARIREEEFGAIVYDFVKEKAIAVNKTGLSILRLLEERSCTLDQLIEELSHTYEGDAATIRNQVTMFVEKMMEAGIIRGGNGNEQ